jgi:hypothetical protein
MLVGQRRNARARAERTGRAGGIGGFLVVEARRVTHLLRRRREARPRALAGPGTRRVRRPSTCRTVLVPSPARPRLNPGGAATPAPKVRQQNRTPHTFTRQPRPNSAVPLRQPRQPRDDRFLETIVSTGVEPATPRPSVRKTRGGELRDQPERRNETRSAARQACRPCLPR